MTHADMAAKLSATTGREIRFVDASEEHLRHAMQEVGMPPWQIDRLVEDYAHYARGEAALVSDGVERATGQFPRNFEMFARDYAGEFDGDQTHPQKTS